MLEEGDEERRCWCRGQGYEDKGEEGREEVGVRVRLGQWGVEES